MPRFSNKELTPTKVATTVHINKLVHNSRRKIRAQRAIKEIVKAGQNLMGTETVKVDQELNSFIWKHGKSSTPTRVRVVFERKADEKNDNEMITVASYKEVATFKNLQSEKIVDQ